VQIDPRKVGALVVFACGALTALIVATPPETAGHDAAVDFIKSLVTVFPAQSGISVQFTGRFTPIPDELLTDLQRRFPNVEFRVAEMTYIHWGPDPVRLLIVSDRASRRVVSYLWDPSFTEPTTSLTATFVGSGSLRDLGDFQAACTALGRIVAFCMDGHIGRVLIEPPGSAEFPRLDRVAVELVRGDWKSVMRVRYQIVGGNIFPGPITFDKPGA